MYIIACFVAKFFYWRAIVPASRGIDASVCKNRSVKLQRKLLVVSM